MSMRMGLPRTKSGRSDLPPDQKSMSMSCSDKLLMWSCVGFQGAVLANFLAAGEGSSASQKQTMAAIRPSMGTQGHEQQVSSASN